MIIKYETPDEHKSPIDKLLNEGASKPKVACVISFDKGQEQDTLTELVQCFDDLANKIFASILEKSNG